MALSVSRYGACLEVLIRCKNFRFKVGEYMLEISRMVRPHPYMYNVVHRKRVIYGFQIHTAEYCIHGCLETGFEMIFACLASYTCSWTFGSRCQHLQSSDHEATGWYGTEVVGFMGFKFLCSWSSGILWVKQMLELLWFYVYVYKQLRRNR